MTEFIDFKVGDKVRVKKERAERYIQPWRKWAESGRVGVILFIDENSTFCAGNIKVDFAGKRKPKYPPDYWNWYFAKELDLVGDEQ